MTNIRKIFGDVGEDLQQSKNYSFGVSLYGELELPGKACYSPRSWLL